MLTTALILSILLIFIFGMAANVPTPQGRKTIGINISTDALAIVDASTAQRHKLGTRALGDDGTEYVYAEFGGTVTAKDICIIDTADAQSPWSFIQSSGAAVQGVCVAMASGTDGKFGWFAVKGKVTGVNVATGVAVNRPFVNGGTAGRGADYAGTETVIPLGVVTVEAASNAATVFLFGLI